MPLPEPVQRQKLHDRNIRCEGFKRSDGFWDIEAHLVDKRSFDCGYEEGHRDGMIKAGDAVHDMSLRLTIDARFVIRDACSVSDSTPFAVCPKAASAMQKLIGLKIGKGWIREARNRIGVNISCTHLMDLLYPIATTAYQTLHAGFEEETKRLPKGGKPPLIDTCLAFAADGEVVLRLWPEFATSHRAGPADDTNECS